MMYPTDYCDPLTSFKWNVLTCIEWIVMKFSTGIHVTLRMNSNNFGDALTSHLAALSSQIFNFTC